MRVTSRPSTSSQVSLEQQRRGWWSQQVSRLHLPGHNASSQAQRLNELIVERVEALENADAVKTFVQSRFQARMESHLKRAPWLGFTHTFLGAVAIGGGVATSTLAAGGSGSSRAVVILGILVATAAGLNQIFKFAKRSAVRFRAGNELRREAWDFILGSGSYRGLDPKPAFDAFYDKIWRIEAPVDLSVELNEDDRSQ